ncbi:acyl dehydratase [uncultured Roseobacter sp.]|uniref:acyl dehydratase n=1 Tax=uncultured Roseobacter sp. TaxID=114847 RepID=UPI00261D8B0B|nr:acyl dehydratase [uncultured Roseobacter sp.]
MQDATQDGTSQSDLMDPARANALLVTLGIDRQIAVSEPLPPFFHQIYFWDAQPAQKLGGDGHPKTGGLIPDTGLPRRMWAGGRLSFDAPLRAGLMATKTSVCESVTHKDGRSGPLALVTLRHEIRQQGALCVTERQDLIYRAAATPDAPGPVAPKAPRDEDAAKEVRFSTTRLFRYSALTFNGHRIHYDEDYARGTEGYDGLVVHGPLLAQLLMLFASDSADGLRRFSFRATAPLMHHEVATLCRKKQDLWVRAADGRLCMRAEFATVSE